MSAGVLPIPWQLATEKAQLEYAVQLRKICVTRLYAAESTGLTVQTVVPFGRVVYCTAEEKEDLAEERHLLLRPCNRKGSSNMPGSRDRDVAQSGGIHKGDRDKVSPPAEDGHPPSHCNQLDKHAQSVQTFLRHKA